MLLLYRTKALFADIGRKWAFKTFYTSHFSLKYSSHPIPSPGFFHFVSGGNVMVETPRGPTAHCHLLSRAGKEFFWRVCLCDSRRAAGGLGDWGTCWLSVTSGQCGENYWFADKWNTTITKPTLGSVLSVSKASQLGRLPQGQQSQQEGGMLWFVVPVLGSHRELTLLSGRLRF